MSATGGGPNNLGSGSVLHAFRRCAVQSPDRFAVHDGDLVMTYGELERRSRCIAAGLRSCGIGRGDRVMIAFGRSADFIAVLLGVARAGAAYVPVDPAWPATRVASLRAIVAPAAVVVQDGASSTIHSACGVDELLSEGAAYAEPFVDTIPAAHDPIYIMFTSGTTGDPKGVVVPHRAVARLVLDPDFMTTDGQRIWLQLAATSFDAATLEVWAPLVRGHSIAVVHDAIPSLDRIADSIENHGVTDAWLTASLFNAMVDHRLDAFAGMRQVLTGGERLSPAHVARFLQRWPGVRLINGYGPTENTTFTCCHTIQPQDTRAPDGVPIGVPIRGTTIRIVDDNLVDVGVGEPGELLAGGDGLALGYLGDRELTERRFARTGDDGSRWYRTGDRVRRDSPDAPIVFLGRTDRQVKVRGHRIELEEVERVLCSHPAVTAAFAMVSGERADERRLIAAFVVAPDHEMVTAESLRSWALDRAPKPFVPDWMKRLDAFPSGPNGKADRGAIEEMLTRGEDGTPYPKAREYPANQTAASTDDGDAEFDESWDRLASLVREVLPGVSFGREVTFVSIGGHSLAALRLAALANLRFGVDLSLAQLLGGETLGTVSKSIRSDGNHRPAPPDTIEQMPRASSIQRQFFFENAVDPTGIAYLEHAAFIIESGAFEPERMVAAFDRLLARHAALRTRLVMRDDDLVQEIDPIDRASDRRATVHPRVERAGAELAELVRNASARPFDLEAEWPARIDLFPLEHPGWAVVLTFQHAAIDEWSLRIIADELGRLYDDPSAPLGTALPYSAYSARESAESDPSRAQPIADVLRAIGRPPLRLGRAPAEAMTRTLPWPDPYKAAAANLGVTPTVFGCGVYAATLARVTGQRRIALLTPVTRRLGADLQRVVGCCNMMHPVVIETADPGSRAGIEATIQSAASAIANAYAITPVPFEAVARAIHQQGAGDQSPVPFGYAFETNDPFCPSFNELRARPLPIWNSVARFPVGFSIDHRGTTRSASFAVPRANGAAELLTQLTETIDEVAATLGVGAEPRSPGANAAEMTGHEWRGREQHQPDAIVRVSDRSDPIEAGIDTRQLASDAWTAVLGSPPVSDRQNFFESGGHSLLLLRLSARIRSQAGIEIPLGAFLESPTFASLVELIVQRTGDRGRADTSGFQVEEFGDGGRVIVCIPGAFGRPISFAQLADTFTARGSGVRLRCYNVYDAMSGRTVTDGFERVLGQLEEDFENPQTVGMLGFCAGGLYPLFLHAIAESRMRRLRLWLLNVYAPDCPEDWLSLRMQSVRDALLEPGLLPSATRDSLVTLWRMAMVRLRVQDEGVSADQFFHVEFQKLLARRSLGVWRGSSTVVIAGRKPIWRTYYRNSRLNGLAANLQGPTRKVVLPLMHHELLNRGVDAVADAIDQDIGVFARDERAS